MRRRADDIEPPLAKLPRQFSLSEFIHVSRASLFADDAVAEHNDPASNDPASNDAAFRAFVGAGSAAPILSDADDKACVQARCKERCEAEDDSEREDRAFAQLAGSLPDAALAEIPNWPRERARVLEAGT